VTWNWIASSEIPDAIKAARHALNISLKERNFPERGSQPAWPIHCLGITEQNACLRRKDETFPESIGSGKDPGREDFRLRGKETDHFSYASWWLAGFRRNRGTPEGDT
jgi:hypothetical protein